MLLCNAVWNRLGLVILTLAGLSITAKAETRATAAGSALVTITQQTDIRATAWLPKLIGCTRMTADCKDGQA